MGFQQGLSGLNAASHQLDVHSNNIANADTIGFKGSRAEFGDMYIAKIEGAGMNQAGMGVETLAVTPSTLQGSIVQTDRSLDLAITNSGYFVMRTGIAPSEARGSGGATAVTRNGQFQIDQNGFIVNNGDRLQGWMAQKGEVVQGQITDLQLLTSTMAPQATTAVSMPVNLDSRQKEPVAAPLDPSNPDTFNWSNAFAAFDSLGNEHTVTLYYVKNVAPPLQAPAGSSTAWTVTAYVDGEKAPSDPYVMGFSNTGSLLNPVPFAVTSPALKDGAVSPLQFSIDYTNSSQYAQSASTNSLVTNGYGPGALQKFVIDKTGIIQTTYTNGQTLALGQVALADFVNPQGLRPLGGNRLASTLSSGQMSLNAPGSGQAGYIQSGALEESNIDMTAELVQMITSQRWFQAAAQVLKTEDQVMQTAINIR